MPIEDLYTKHGITDKVMTGQKILAVVPSKDHSLKSFFDAHILDSCEVAITYPKHSDANVAREIILAEATECGSFAVQVDCSFTRKIVQWNSGQEADPRIIEARGQTFVNLHHHDEFSKLDGLGQVDDLIKINLSRKSPFVCVSNHGGVGGWIKQYNRCKSERAKAIFAMEGYFQDYRGDDPEQRKINRKNFHLMLIAKNKDGFKNIIRIHNDAQLNGFYYAPRVNFEAIKKWGKNVIGSSACMQGAVPQALMAGDEAKATEIYEKYRDSFEEFYLELPMIEMADQADLNRKMVTFAKKVGAKLIVTLDSHYLYREHFETHNLLLCIRQHKTINEVEENPEEVWQFKVGGLFCRDEQDLYKLFKEMHEGGDFTEDVFWEAVKNTRRIAASCEHIKLDSTFKLPKLYKDAEKELRQKAIDGLCSRGLDGVVGYNERLMWELDIICKLEFADYFLIVEKLVTEAREKFGEWSAGYGRGSGAGSLVLYSLKVTDIDPIRCGLLFERFMSLDRKDDCPDVDLDFHPDVRVWVKQRIVELFGEKYTCSIGTYQTYKTKAVIVDVARALGLDPHEAQSVTKGMDSLTSFEVGAGDDIEEQKIDQMEIEEIGNHYPELMDYFIKYPQVMQHAKVLRFQVKNSGKHAGGMIISNLDLSDEIPVFRDKDDEIVSAWTEGQNTHELSAVGLVKFDILGLSNLAIIKDCVGYIQATKGVKLDRSRISIDDKEAIKVGSRDDLVGIFQFEHPSTKVIADAVKMDCLNDLSAVTSLLRPGPRDMGMDMEYAKRKNGESRFELLDCLKPILADRQGILIYQEDTMRIAQVLSGFSPIESNKLRKVLIKEKNPAILESMKKKFIDGAKFRVDKGEITEDEVRVWFDMIKSFSGYGFCAAHAYSYSAISAAELYLKYHFKTEYVAALINNAKTTSTKPGEKPEIVKYINYARKNDIRVLPPSVNHSADNFLIEGPHIRFGLSAIKQVGKGAASIREYAPYTDIEDFYNRVPKRSVNKRVFTALVLAGAFDEIAPSVAGDDPFEKRKAIMAVYETLRKAEKKMKEDDKPFELKSLKECQEQEEEMLNICLSRTPIRLSYKDTIIDKKWCTIDKMRKRQATYVFCRIESVVDKNSKAGNPMKLITIGDDVDQTMIYVFEKAMVGFTRNVKKGMIVALPVKPIGETGDGRCFNVEKEVIVVKK